jgi:hypothetical protein
MAQDAQSRPWETQFLLRVALVIYTVTVLIGLFNGFHIVDLSRAVLLTHLHAGTLGWITLGAFAAAYWLYAGPNATMDGHAKGVAVAMAIAVPLYVAAFLSGNFVARAVFGTPVLLLIVGMVVYLLRNLGTGPMTAPRLGILLSFTVLVIGSTIGVLLQIQDAANHTFLPDNAISGHAAAQVAGYLLLSALSLIDWRLNGAKPLGWAGGIQVVLLFLAGILVATGALLNIQPLLGIFIPLSLIALLIFLFRIGGKVLGTNWMAATSARHYAIAVPWVIVNLVTTIIAIVIAIQVGFNNAPFNLFVAADHAMFIGVMTNVIFALIQDYTADRERTWPFTEDVVFWVMNLALVGFVLALLLNQQWMERLFVPFQGLAILVGIIAYSMRLAAPPASSADIEPVAATG